MPIGTATVRHPVIFLGTLKSSSWESLTCLIWCCVNCGCQTGCPFVWPYTNHQSMCLYVYHAYQHLPYIYLLHVLPIWLPDYPLHMLSDRPCMNGLLGGCPCKVWPAIIRSLKSSEITLWSTSRSNDNEWYSIISFFMYLYMYKAYIIYDICIISMDIFCIYTYWPHHWKWKVRPRRASTL